MKEQEKLLDAIRTAPDHDSPRYAYADWLERNGDAPYAQFIRDQCEMARCGDADENYEKLSASENDWFHHHEQRWTAELGFGDDAYVDFRRGLVEVLGLSTADFFRHGSNLPGRFPSLHDLSIGRCARPCHPLSMSLETSCQVQLQPREFDRGQIADLIKIISPKRLPNLRALLLHGIALGGHGFQMLLKAPVLAQLDELYVEVCGLDSQDAAALAKCPGLKNIRQLSLSYNSIGDDGALALARSRRLSGVTRLSLVGNNIGDQGAEALVESDLLSLERLDLRENSMDRKAAISMLSSDVLQRPMVALDVGFN